MNAVVKILPSVLVLVVTGPGVWAEELDLSGRTTAGDDTYVACTCVGIREGKWTINGNVTYAGSPAEGLLMNVLSLPHDPRETTENPCFLGVFSSRDPQQVTPSNG